MKYDIPSRFLAVHVQDYLDKQPDPSYHEDPGFPAPMVALAERSNVPWRTLKDILNGTSATVDFNIADRLLCGMRRPDLWYEWPLVVFYFAADLSDPAPPEDAFCPIHGVLIADNAYATKTMTKAGRGILWRCAECQKAKRRESRAKARALVAA